MLRTRRPLTLLGSAAVALLLVSCGVKAGDGATTPAGSDPTATTAPSAPKDLTPQQRQLADKMAEAYKGLGFTDKEATCLSEGLAGTIDPSAGTTPDVSGMMDILNQCDIPIDRLMDIQGNMGDGTPEGALKESLAAGFKANGMSQKDADCVASAFIDKYGVDVQAMSDPDKMLPLAEQCGVDLSKIRPGG